MMKIEIKPGAYLVAVSGGVDSMVLLDLLAGLVTSRQSLVASQKSEFPSYHFTVAHFNHGIRPDSHLDKELVEATAKKYGLDFVSEEGKLGANTSEAKAREARYRFLESVFNKVKARGIITAHHQDDVLETAIINMLRGTSRRGLTSLASREKLFRPLLAYPKSVIKIYAKNHNLQWREDPTNQDTNYLRNYVRHKILPKFSADQKQQLLKHIDNLRELNVNIDKQISVLISGQKELDRQMFINLNHATAREVMAGWLRSHGVTDFDSKRLELLVRGAKTLPFGKRLAIDKNHNLKVDKDKLALVGRER